MSFLSDNDYGSPSPYPPSSSPSDSDVDHSIPRITSILRTSITSVSEAHLRAIMIKLADNDPHFQHAIMNELSNLAAFDTPPVAPITPTPRGKTYRRVPRHRKPSVRNSKPVDYNSPPQEENAVIGKTIYHPGELCLRHSSSMSIIDSPS